MNIPHDPNALVSISPLVLEISLFAQDTFALCLFQWYCCEFHLRSTIAWLVSAYDIDWHWEETIRSKCFARVNTDRSTAVRGKTGCSEPIPRRRTANWRLIRRHCPWTCCWNWPRMKLNCSNSMNWLQRESTMINGWKGTSKVQHELGEICNCWNSYVHRVERENAHRYSSRMARDPVEPLSRREKKNRPIRSNCISPSRLIPIFKQRENRQYWHWLRWCVSIGHFRLEEMSFERSDDDDDLCQLSSLTFLDKYNSNCVELTV